MLNCSAPPKPALPSSLPLEMLLAPLLLNLRLAFLLPIYAVVVNSYLPFYRSAMLRCSSRAAPSNKPHALPLQGWLSALGGGETTLWLRSKLISQATGR